MSGLEMGRHLWRNGVHDVADEGHRTRDGNGLIDERQVVARRIATRSLTRLLHTEHVVAALGKREEQRQQERHQHNPLAEHHTCGKTAGKDTQHKAEGYDADIDDSMVFQFGTISQIEQPIEKDDEGYPHPSFSDNWDVDCGQQADGQHGEQEHQSHEAIGLTNADESCGNRTMALHGMATIGLHIDKVVKAIDARRGKAEGDKRQDGRQQIGAMKQITTKEQRQEHEEVLDPLFGTDET